MIILKKKYEKILHHHCCLLEVPFSICAGILFIETTYRKWWFRMCENICLTLGMILNLIFKIRFRNYTIGVCQIGVSTILSYNNTPAYQHLDYIDKINFNDFLRVISAMYYRNNIKIFCYRIQNIITIPYISCKTEVMRAYEVGKVYNGKFVYGLQLQKLVEEENKNTEKMYELI